MKNLNITTTDKVGMNDNNPTAKLHVPTKTLEQLLKEMEIMGKEMSYSDGYKEGYKRALELIEWYIKNINKEKDI
jgi:hypothetical protein